MVIADPSTIFIEPLMFGFFRRGGTTSSSFQASPSPSELPQVSNKMHDTDPEEGDDGGSVAPTDESSFASMRRVPTTPQRGQCGEQGGGDCKWQWRVRDIVVSNRSALLACVLFPILLAVALTVGILLSYWIILKSSKVPDVDITGCTLQRAWLGREGQLNADVEFKALVTNREDRQAIIRGGKVSLFYPSDKGVELAQAVLGHKLLPKSPGAVEETSLVTIEDLNGIRDGLGSRLAAEAIGLGNSTFHLSGMVPIYVNLMRPSLWLPASLHVNCSLYQTWGREDGRVTSCNNRFHAW